jgi:tRNA U34 5-carboxymethylaminomethyl modifying GTPase MnmE/TrmE
MPVRVVTFRGGVAIVTPIAGTTRVKASLIQIEGVPLQM